MIVYPFQEEHCRKAGWNENPLLRIAAAELEIQDSGTRLIESLLGHQNWFKKASDPYVQGDR